MKLIEREWNIILNKYINVWLADNEDGIVADFDPEGAEGSTIIVISTASTWMKNVEGKWQKVGTEEVV